MAGGRVRGWKRSEMASGGSGEASAAASAAQKERWVEKSERKLEDLPQNAQDALKLIEEYGLMSDVWDLWPLQLLDTGSPPTQLTLIFITTGSSITIY